MVMEQMLSCVASSNKKQLFAMAGNVELLHHRSTEASRCMSSQLMVEVEDFCPLWRQVAAGYVLHVGEAAEGKLRVGDTVSADVDTIRRKRIVPNHTFTHVLNFALREARLRFSAASVHLPLLHRLCL